MALVIGLIGFGVMGWAWWSGRLNGRSHDHWVAVNRGRALLKAGRPDLAFQEVSEIRDEAPGAGEAMTIAGLSLLEFGQLSTARLALERGLTLQPDQPDAVKALGAIALSTGNLVRGVEYLEETIRHEPDDPRLWLVLAKVRRNLEQPEESARAFAEVVRLDPTHREAYEGWIDQLLVGNHVEEAGSRLVQALKLWPDDTVFLGLAARQAWAAGQEEQARNYADRVLALDPDNVDGRLARARVDFKAGRAESALEDLLVATKGDPNNIAAWQLKAQVESRLGRDAQAAESVRRLQLVRDFAEQMDQVARRISERPDDPEPRYRMGQIAAAAGLIPMARESYQASLTLDPNYEPARAALAALSGSPSPEVSDAGSSESPRAEEIGKPAP